MQNALKGKGQSERLGVALLTLGDIMQNYQLWQLVAALNIIKSLENLLEKHCDNDLRDVYIREPFISKMVRPHLSYCKIQCEVIDLQSALHRLNGNLHANVNAGAYTHEQLLMQLRELRADIDRDLIARRFFFVPVHKAAQCDNVEALWGVWKVFPESEDDIRQSVDCFIFGLYTASVFHGMRVAEHGLRMLAKKLRVKLTHSGRPMPIDLATWDKVITQCKNKIEELRKRSKSHRNDAQLQIFSEAADHCMFMKDIWRNPVDHSRKSCNEGDALRVTHRVHDFMEFMARGL